MYRIVYVYILICLYHVLTSAHVKQILFQELKVGLMQDLSVADPEEAWFVIRVAWVQNPWASLSHVLIS